jgi:hypothetical protein
LKTLMILLLLPAQLLAQVALSEVLYNEPGSNTSLEWIELYNRADSAIDLNNIMIVTGSDTTAFSHSSIVPAREYIILARRLLSSDNAPSFEGHWGDSSGFWGDSPRENYPAFEANMSLSNASGTVYLLSNGHQLIDQCTWNEPAEDGQSLERDDVELPSNSWHFSSDSSGSTPGKANSLPLGLDNELFTVSSKILSQSRGEMISIDYALPSGNTITLEILDDSGRRQVTLGEKLQRVGRVVWDGKDGGGKNLYPGVYLLLSTISGPKSGTKCIPVVVAP